MHGWIVSLLNLLGMGGGTAVAPVVPPQPAYTNLFVYDMSVASLTAYDLSLTQLTARL